MKNPFYTLHVGKDAALTYRVASSDVFVPLSWPVFEIDGLFVSAAPADFCLTQRRSLNEDLEQLTFSGRCGAGCVLTMELRLCPKTPFIRFRYLLSSEKAACLTKHKGETLCYLSYPSPTCADRVYPVLHGRLTFYSHITRSPATLFAPRAVFIPVK